MSLKEKRIGIRVAVHGTAVAFLLLVLVTATALGAVSVGGVLSLGLIAYLLTMRVNPIPRRLEQAVLRDYRCSACGAMVPLVGTWNCRCGFVSWYPRHALAPCRHCRGTFDVLQCPRCEQGVEL